MTEEEARYWLFVQAMTNWRFFRLGMPDRLFPSESESESEINLNLLYCHLIMHITPSLFFNTIF